MLRRLGQLFYDHLIRPFTETFAPIPEVAWGAVVGMFIGLLPLMGIQMYVAATVWVICRYVFRFRFNLGIAVALVWITNPITVLPIYYTYLLSGNWALQFFGPELQPMDYAEFTARFSTVLEHPDMSVGERLARGTLLLLWEFGWPILFGSLLYAVPVSVLSYPLTAAGLHTYRRGLAQGAGLSYEQWEREFVRSNADPVPGPGSPPAPGG